MFSIRTTVLGSRDQLCIHDRVCKEQDTRVKTNSSVAGATYRNYRLLCVAVWSQSALVTTTIILIVGPTFPCISSL
ncbi:unnamed protein product [Cylicostephanus goldi]|uniref:RAD3-like helicase DEAD domain-containing protein n=1 Tax=Cylicostephanus goldi TaxID=71465 RepID=A0A3P6RZA7_CYLGO|nr:unnamed protein product [Cylicostephanus goldi]